jgi:S-formylglutathione hydrolase FrmB
VSEPPLPPDELTPESTPKTSPVSRRGLLVGAASLGGAALLAGYTGAAQRVARHLGIGPGPYIPEAPQGQVRLETIRSAARGRRVHLFTAVPHGYGDGAGLPVVIILHGATATAADFQPFGLGHFLTAAVQQGAAPFVLAGADGGAQYWEPNPATGDNPQAMVLHEMPGWLTQRGFDASTRAMWGWSMGGYGSLRIAEIEPGWARAVAAFSPAVSVGDSVFASVDALASTPLGVWCGTDDPLYASVRRLVARLPRRPQILTYGPGGHDRYFWNDHTVAAFRFLAARLAA